MKHLFVKCNIIYLGVGTIHGIECAISSSDVTVKGGTFFPIGIKKQLRIQDISYQNRIPFISIVDSAGLFLPLQVSVTMFK